MATRRYYLAARTVCGECLLLILDLYGFFFFFFFLSRLLLTETISVECSETLPCVCCARFALFSRSRRPDSRDAGKVGRTLQTITYFYCYFSFVLLRGFWILRNASNALRLQPSSVVTTPPPPTNAPPITEPIHSLKMEIAIGILAVAVLGLLIALIWTIVRKNNAREFAPVELASLSAEPEGDL